MFLKKNWPRSYSNVRYYVLFILHFSFFIFLSSCERPYAFEQTVEVGKTGWDADSSYVFTFHISDATRPYDLIYTLRHNLDYPFYNLYMKYELQDSLGKTWLTDRHQVQLLDPETGKPRGSGLGGVYSKDFMGIQKLRFKKSGTYRFKLIQYMRKDPLPGIVSIGIQVREEEDQ